MAPPAGVGACWDVAGVPGGSDPGLTGGGHRDLGGNHLGPDVASSMAHLFHAELTRSHVGTRVQHAHTGTFHVCPTTVPKRSGRLRGKAFQAKGLTGRFLPRCPPVGPGADVHVGSVGPRRTLPGTRCPVGGWGPMVCPASLPHVQGLRSQRPLCFAPSFLGHLQLWTGFQANAASQKAGRVSLGGSAAPPLRIRRRQGAICGAGFGIATHLPSWCHPPGGSWGADGRAAQEGSALWGARGRPSAGGPLRPPGARPPTPLCGARGPSPPAARGQSPWGPAAKCAAVEGSVNSGFRFMAQIIFSRRNNRNEQRT